MCSSHSVTRRQRSKKETDTPADWEETGSEKLSCDFPAAALFFLPPGAVMKERRRLAPGDATGIRKTGLVSILTEKRSGENEMERKFCTRAADPASKQSRTRTSLRVADSHAADDT